MSRKMLRLGRVPKKAHATLCHHSTNCKRCGKKMAPGTPVMKFKGIVWCRKCST